MSGARFWTTAARVAAILVLAACGSAAPQETTPADEPDAPASTAVGGHLPDGETFAWVKGLTGDGLLVDPAEMLTGEAARQAAVEDGAISEGEDLPNDFYIRDETDETLVMTARDGATYALMLFADGTPTETDVSLDEFAAALEGADPDVYGVVDGVIPAMVEIEEGQIVSVRQMYLP
ncbi:MAG TPA: hypothetical protein VHL52_06945 [Acidimicrobiia bacterium]|nr:hypothetical protein [Acidimicrobiia bacterium]